MIDPENREALSDRRTREGFGPDACDQDRIDAPTRDRLQRLYGSVDLLADRSRATADGQYEDVKALEVIIGDLRAENEVLRAQVASHRATAMERDDFLYRIGKISREYEARLHELSGQIDEEEATG